MSKNVITDIKIKKTAIRKLPPAEILVSEESIHEQFTVETNNVKKKKLPISKWLFFAFIFVVLFGASYFISMYFAYVKVAIQPKSKDFTFNNEHFNASKAVNSALSFEITVLSDKVAKDVNFIKGEDVSTYAKGGVILYNEYSSKAQSFPANTKLSDINNKIYKTDKAVSIPGYKISKGKIIPGSALVSVTASAFGDSYNGDPRDFSLPILKNTPKYKKIYGRSKTPLSGGQIGSVYVLSPETKGELDGFANSSFNESMLKKIEAEIPPGYILYRTGTNFSYLIDDKSKSDNPEGKAYINGTIKAILLNKIDLEHAVVRHIIPDITPEELDEVTVSDLSSLTFAFTDNSQIIDKDTSIFSFTLSGSSKLLWHPNQDRIAKSLLGVSKNSVQEILKMDPGVENAQVAFYPPWQSYLPNNLKKIHIVLNNLTSN